MDIVIETNRYGSQKKPESWEPITVNDRERLFALVMLTGIIRKPTLKSYWSTDPTQATPFIGYRRLAPSSTFSIADSLRYISPKKKSP